jgi:hypothetical protein
VLYVGGIEKFIANKWRILGSAAAKEIDFQCLHFSFPVGAIGSNRIKQTQFRLDDQAENACILLRVYFFGSILCNKILCAVNAEY